jgi:hypothetical protein
VCLRHGGGRPCVRSSNITRSLPPTNRAVSPHFLCPTPPAGQRLRWSWPPSLMRRCWRPAMQLRSSCLPPLPLQLLVALWLALLAAARQARAALAWMLTLGCARGAAVAPAFRTCVPFRQPSRQQVSGVCGWIVSVLALVLCSCVCCVCVVLALVLCCVGVVLCWRWCRVAWCCVATCWRWCCLVASQTHACVAHAWGAYCPHLTAAAATAAMRACKQTNRCWWRATTGLQQR